MRAAVHASSLSREALIKLWGRDLGGLPGWLAAPDVCQTEFVNQSLAVLWPHIDRAATEWAFTDRHLETLLNSQSFWKPAWLAASGVVLQALLLGQAPPRVTGIKVYPPEQGRSSKALCLDISFDWASKMQVQMAMKTLPGAPQSAVDKLLSVLYSALPVKVSAGTVYWHVLLEVVLTLFSPSRCWCATWWRAARCASPSPRCSTRCPWPARRACASWRPQRCRTASRPSARIPWWCQAWRPG